VPGLSRG